MINFIQAFLDVQKVKKDISNMTFEDAKELCAGYNETKDSFEFNYRNLCGLIYNENGKPILKENSCFDVYDTEHTKNGFVFHGTESEILEKVSSKLEKLEYIQKILDWFEYHNKNLTKQQFYKIDEIRYILNFEVR